MSFLVCLGSKSGQFWRLDLDPFCTYQMWPIFISGQIYLLLRGQNQEPFGYQICTNFLGPDTNLFWVPDLEPYLIIFVQFWAPDLEPFLATRNGNQNWLQIWSHFWLPEMVTKIGPLLKIYKGTSSGPQKWSQNWHQKWSHFWLPEMVTKFGTKNWTQKSIQKVVPKTRPKNRPQNWIPNLDSKPARQQAGRTASEPASQTKQTASRTDSQQASQATN
jgi:hypothetical protein